MFRLKLKFIKWFHSKFPGKYCWADCVAWAYSKSWNPFTVDRSEGCKKESTEHSTKSCYCGGWQKGKCFDLLSKEDQEKIVAGKYEIVSEQSPF